MFNLVRPLFEDLDWFTGGRPALMDQRVKRFFRRVQKGTY